MIFFIIYILLGCETAYITGAIMTVKETDFDASDLLVWWAFWPFIVFGHIVAWAIVKEKDK